MRSGILSTLPYPLQILVGFLIHRKSSQTLYGQGTARYTAEERTAFKKQIWGNVNALLATSRSKQANFDQDDSVFWVLGGDEPSEADATLFGFITGALVCAA